jgi:chromosome segregation ATPase
MSVVPFANGPESDAEPAAPSDAADPQQQVLALKAMLEAAVGDCTRLQNSLVSQQQLEQLLRQGRTHLQEMRSRLEQATADRGRLEAEVNEANDARNARQREVGDLQTQLGNVREELQQAAAERDRLARQLAEQEAAHQRYVEDRTEDRIKFERLLAEATSNQRQMVEELGEQQQQLDTLREAAMRAQSLAREIMRAHEKLQLKAVDPKE